LVVRVFPEDAPPLDVELREPGDGAFEVFGPFGLSPIVEVADYADLPQGQRDAFERLVRYLDSEGHAGELLGAAAPALEPIYDWVRFWPPARALALAALLFAGATRRLGPLPSGRQLMGLFTLALGLRLAFGLWGPLHVNGQGALWIHGVLDPSRLSLYGPGYPELFGWARSLARPDLAIFAANAALGALIAPLAFRVGELSGLRRPAALAVGLVLAIDPVSVRISASESYLSPLGCLLMLMALSVALARTHRERGESSGMIWSLLAAGLFASQIALTHPVGWLPAALLPLIALGTRGRWVKQLLFVGLVGLVIGLLTLLISGPVIAANLAHARSYGGSAHLDSWLLVEFGLGLALLLLWTRRRGSSSLAFLALAAFATDLATRKIYGQSALWMASFDRLYLPMMLWGAASLLPRRVSSLRACVGMAAATGLALVLFGPELRSRTTEQLEYDFVAERLSRAPAGCWVAYVREAERRVISLPVYAVPRTPEGTRGQPSPVEGPADLDVLAVRAPCLLYVHSSLCQSREGAEACRRVEEGASLEHIAGTQLEARPSYDGLPYDSPRVAVDIFRVRPRR
jgi:hypothetical protein